MLKQNFSLICSVTRMRAVRTPADKVFFLAPISVDPVCQSHGNGGQQASNAENMHGRGLPHSPSVASAEIP